MPLDINKLKQRMQEGHNAEKLAAAKFHQQRIKFHVEKRVESSPFASAQATVFLDWVKNLLPNDKFTLFKLMFRYPIKTNEVTGICFDKLSRVFDGRNPVYKFNFLTTEIETDWERYRLEKLHEPHVWQTKGWDYFKTEPNSILIVDLPQVQLTEYPEPYFYWLSIDRVITYEADPDTGIMEYIVFRDKGRIVVIDDFSYRVWNDKENSGQIHGEPKEEYPHGLAYCPARFFWNEPIEPQRPDIKVSPITGQLESLDWFLFFHISKRHLDLFGSYPILSGYEQACDYSNAENGDYCDGGFLKNKEGIYYFDPAGILLPCPKCGKKRIIGAGSFVEIPVPNAEENQPDLRNPVQMLSVDKNSLDYNVGECDRLKMEIIRAVVGQGEEITQREAYNEQQVMASFESQSTILNRIKKGFEEAQQWVDETICRLRYRDYFISGYVNYGTEFYLFTTNELRAKYKIAKESGASESELDALSNQIIETEYRNNPIAKQRMDILSEIEPYPHLNRTEMLEMFEKELISPLDMRIKLNFSNFVRRFERENTNIMEFGSAIPYSDKINRIKAEILRYAKEQDPE